MANAADFGAGDGDLDGAVAGDLLLELFVEAGLEFANLAAAETGDVDMIAGAVGFVVVAVAAKMEEIEFVDEAFAFKKIDGAIDSDEMDFGIDFLCSVEDLVHVEMPFGGIHDLEDDAALASEANAALTKGVLEMAGGLGNVDALAAGDPMRRSSSHGTILGRVSGHGLRIHRKAESGGWKLEVREHRTACWRNSLLLYPFERFLISRASFSISSAFFTRFNESTCVESVLSTSAFNSAAS